MPRLHAAVGEPKLPFGLGVSSGVIEATQMAPLEAIEHSQVPMPAAHPLDAPACSLSLGGHERDWAQSDTVTQHERVGASGQHQGEVDDCDDGGMAVEQAPVTPPIVEGSSSGVDDAGAPVPFVTSSLASLAQMFEWTGKCVSQPGQSGHIHGSIVDGERSELQHEVALVGNWDPMAGLGHTDEVEPTKNPKTEEVVKKVNVGKPTQARSKTKTIKHRFGNLALAVREDTPIVKEVKRGSLSRALRSGAPGTPR